MKAYTWEHNIDRFAYTNKAFTYIVDDEVNDAITLAPFDIPVDKEVPLPRHLNQYKTVADYVSTLIKIGYVGCAVVYQDKHNNAVVTSPGARDKWFLFNRKYFKVWLDTATKFRKDDDAVLHFRRLWHK